MTVGAIMSLTEN